jgi:hypothetical protein
MLKFIWNKLNISKIIFMKMLLMTASLWEILTKEGDKKLFPQLLSTVEQI